MIPLYHRDACNRADSYTEPNSCLRDFSDSLNSMKVLLHLEKTPIELFKLSGKQLWRFSKQLTEQFSCVCEKYSFQKTNRKINFNAKKLTEIAVQISLME